MWKVVKLLWLVSAVLWGYMGCAKVNLLLEQRYGVVRDHEGNVYAVKQYGGYRRAMDTCLLSGQHDGFTVCGPAWK